MHKFLLKGFAKRAINDATSCFLILFTERHQSNEDAANSRARYHRMFKEVTHDGLSHIRKLIISFLVYGKSSSRQMLREIDSSGWPSGWRFEFMRGS